MIISREFENKYFDKKSVVTVGTFDGVHLGHRKIIEDVIKIKSQKKLRSVIVTFDPHPQLVLKNKHKEIKLLSTTEEKLEIFNDFGVDAIYLINFNEEFSKTSADNFYKDYLVDKVGLSDIVIGYDHTFGRNREGNSETLKLLSEKFGFEVHRTEEFRLNGEQVKSTEIRNLLFNGNVGKAKTLLGDFYSISGQVISGDKRGSTIGFPTANIEINDEHKLLPGNGVYFVSVKITGSEFFGMMNIGKRPTISASEEIYLEVNIFDFNKDIYGEKIKVKFIEFLREEKKFGSLDELIKQLEIDNKNCINKLINK